MPRVRPFFSNLKLLSSCSSTCSWSLHVAHDDSTAATDVRTSLQVRLLQCAVNGRPEEENQPFGNCGKDIADYEPDQGKAAQRGALQLRSSGHINARTSISECGWLAFRHRIFFPFSPRASFSLAPIGWLTLTRLLSSSWRYLVGLVRITKLPARPHFT